LLLLQRAPVSTPSGSGIPQGPASISPYLQAVTLNRDFSPKKNRGVFCPRLLSRSLNQSARGRNMPAAKAEAEGKKTAGGKKAGYGLCV